MGDTSISSMPGTTWPLSSEPVPCAQRGTTVRAPAVALGIPVAGVSPPEPLAQYQTWIDQSASPPMLRMYMGSSWVALYSIGPDGSIVPAQSFVLPGSPTANSQAATKHYVDNRAGALGTVVFRGVVDCSTDPNYPAADQGDFYVVGGAGKIGGPSGVNVGLAATLLCLADDTPAGDQSGVGANWTIGQGNSTGFVTGPGSAVDGNFALFDGASGTLLKNAVLLDTDATMAADSDARIPSQKAVKRALGGKPLGADTPGQGQAWIWDGVSSSFRARDNEGRNFLVNSAFDIWQENTSYPFGNVLTKIFVADFWKAGGSGSGIKAKTISRVAGISGSQYALNIQRNPGSVDTAPIRLAQQFSQTDAMLLSGKTVMISFDFVVGANYTGGGPVAGVIYGTGIDEDFPVGFPRNGSFGTGGGTTLPGPQGSNSQGYLYSNPLPSQVAPPGTVARLINPPLWIPPGMTELICMIYVGGFVGTAGTDDSCTIGNVKLEIGSIATPYRKPNAADELRRCRQRYWKTFLQAAAPVEGADFGTGEHRAAATKAGANAQSLGTVAFAAMRTVPNVTLFNPIAGGAVGQARDFTAGDCASTAVQNVTESSFEIVTTANASTAIGNLIGVHAVADARL